MKKVKLLQQLTVDGFNGDTKGGTRWTSFSSASHKDIDEYFNSLIETSDLLLVGRKMADGFNAVWSQQADNPSNPGYNEAKKLLDMRKVVFSKTVQESRWINASVITGDVKEEVNNLKAGTGKDIIVLGGTSFVSSLIKKELIDEFNLLINPTLLGNGTSIFKDIPRNQQLSLVKTKEFDNGTVLLQYELKI